MTLSARYLPERFLPDKALDLLDEACSAVRIEAAERPGGPEKPAVTAAHIAAVVSRQSGVPAEKLTAAQTATLAAMEQTLSGRVVGQHGAPHGSVFVPGAHGRGKNSAGPGAGGLLLWQ